MIDLKGCCDIFLKYMIQVAIEMGCVAGGFYRAYLKKIGMDQEAAVIVEKFADELVRKKFAVVAPTMPIVTKRTLLSEYMCVASREFVLIEPIDCLQQFIEGRGDFTINIALIRNRTPVLGVVYAPAIGNLFAADADAKIAFRDVLSVSSDGPHKEVIARERIRVRAAPRRSLTAIVSSSDATVADAYLASHPVVRRLQLNSALKFCLIATGDADLYPCLGSTMEWHTAAGHAVLTGAGGSVLSARNLPLEYGKVAFRNPPFVASGFPLCHVSGASSSTSALSLETLCVDKGIKQFLNERSGIERLLGM